MENYLSYLILCVLLGFGISNSFILDNRSEARIISAIQDNGCNVNKRRADK